MQNLCTTSQDEAVVNNVDDVNRTSQEVGMDKVIAEDITQLLDSRGQPHYSEDLEDMVKEISQQEEEEKEKEEEPPLKFMKLSDLQNMFSAMETLTDEL